MHRWVMVLGLSLLVHQPGCGRIAPVEAAWYRHVRSGQLMPVPFSHDLEVLGFQGWRYLGKLPKEAEDADAIRYRVWFEAESLPERSRPNAIEGRWPVARGPEARRVQLDLIVKREVLDGETVVSFRALLNGYAASGRLPIPAGYRQRISIVPVTDPLPLAFDQPIAIGTAKLETWTARESGQIRYFMRHQQYRWFLELTPDRGEPLR